MEAHTQIGRPDGSIVDSQMRNVFCVKSSREVLLNFIVEQFQLKLVFFSHQHQRVNVNSCFASLINHFEESFGFAPKISSTISVISKFLLSE